MRSFGTPLSPIPTNGRAQGGAACPEWPLRGRNGHEARGGHEVRSSRRREREGARTMGTVSRGRVDGMDARLQLPLAARQREPEIQVGGPKTHISLF